MAAGRELEFRLRCINARSWCSTAKLFSTSIRSRFSRSAEAARLRTAIIMRIRRFLVVLLLSAAASCSDYQVVLKNSGKIIGGDFLFEDANTITLQVNKVEVSFKKERLDLERMKELNQSQPGAGLRASVAAQNGATGGAPSDGQSLVRGQEERIAERERTLASFRAQAPSAERDQRIHDAEQDLRLMRRGLLELK